MVANIEEETQQLVMENPEVIFAARDLPFLTAEQRESFLNEERSSFYNRKRIEISNLPESYNHEQAIRESSLFENVEINHLDLDVENRSANILLSTAEAASAMIESRNETEIEGSQIQIRHTLQGYLLFVGNLPYMYTDATFIEVAKEYGPIERIFLARSETTGLCKGYGFVEYKTREMALEAKSKFPKEMTGKRIRVDFAPPIADYKDVHSETLIVDRFPENTDSSEIRDLFGQHGVVAFCQIPMHMGKPKPYCLVDMKSTESAEQAWRTLDGVDFKEGNLQVTFCSPGRPAAGNTSGGRKSRFDPEYVPPPGRGTRGGMHSPPGRGMHHRMPMNPRMQGRHDGPPHHHMGHGPGPRMRPDMGFGPRGPMMNRGGRGGPRMGPGPRMGRDGPSDGPRPLMDVNLPEPGPRGMRFGPPNRFGGPGMRPQRGMFRGGRGGPRFDGNRPMGPRMGGDGFNNGPQHGNWEGDFGFRGGRPPRPDGFYNQPGDRGPNFQGPPPRGPGNDAPFGNGPGQFQQDKPPMQQQNQQQGNFQGAQGGPSGAVMPDQPWNNQQGQQMQGQNQQFQGQGFNQQQQAPPANQPSNQFQQQQQPYQQQQTPQATNYGTQTAYQQPQGYNNVTSTAAVVPQSNTQIQPQVPNQTMYGTAPTVPPPNVQQPVAAAGNAVASTPQASDPNAQYAQYYQQAAPAAAAYAQQYYQQYYQSTPPPPPPMGVTGYTAAVPQPTWTDPSGVAQTGTAVPAQQTVMPGAVDATQQYAWMQASGVPAGTSYTQTNTNTAASVATAPATQSYWPQSYAVTPTAQLPNAAVAATQPAVAAAGAYQAYSMAQPAASGTATSAAASTWPQANWAVASTTSSWYPQQGAATAAPVQVAGQQAAPYVQQGQYQQTTAQQSAQIYGTVQTATPQADYGQQQQQQQQQQQPPQQQQQPQQQQYNQGMYTQDQSAQQQPQQQMTTGDKRSVPNTQDNSYYDQGKRSRFQG